MQTTKKTLIMCAALGAGVAVGFVIAVFLRPDAVVAPIEPATLEEMNQEMGQSVELPPVAEPPVVTPQPPSAEPVSRPTPISEDNVVMCPMDAKSCPDGSFVGRVPPSCAFAPCPHEGGSPTIGVSCTENDRLAEACIEIFAPVCGQTAAGTKTFPNSCFACMDREVISYLAGECST